MKPLNPNTKHDIIFYRIKNKADSQPWAKWHKSESGYSTTSYDVYKHKPLILQKHLNALAKNYHYIIILGNEIIATKPYDTSIAYFTHWKVL